MRKYILDDKEVFAMFEANGKFKFIHVYATLGSKPNFLIFFFFKQCYSTNLRHCDEGKRL